MKNYITMEETNTVQHNSKKEDFSQNSIEELLKLAEKLKREITELSESNYVDEFRKCKEEKKQDEEDRFYEAYAKKFDYKL